MVGSDYKLTTESKVVCSIRMRSSCQRGTQASKFVRVLSTELLGDAALPSFCWDSCWSIIPVCTADMLSRSRCLTRSVGRSVVALRQVRSYSAHVNVPVGEPGRCPQFRVMLS